MSVSPLLPQALGSQDSPGAGNATFNQLNSMILTGGTQGFEPASRARFIALVSRCPGTLTPPNMTGSGGLQWVVKSFTPPSKTIAAGTYEFMNRVLQYPKGREQIDRATLHLWLFCGINSPAYQFFTDWHQLVHNDVTDNVGLLVDGGGPGDCGGEIVTYLLDPSGTDFMSWTLGNVWPSSIKPCTCDRMDDGTDPPTYEITFVVNECTPYFNGSTSAVSSSPSSSNVLQSLLGGLGNVKIGSGTLGNLGGLL